MYGEFASASFSEADVGSNRFHHSYRAGANDRSRYLDDGADVGGVEGGERGFAALEVGGEAYEPGVEGTG